MSGIISGVGLAIAKRIGSLAIDLTISSLTQPAAEIPRNTSAPFIASESEPSRWERLVISAISCLTALSLGSPLQIIPLLSQSVMSFTPILRRCFAIAIPAAPAPFITTLISSSFLWTSLSELIRPAATITAVPCWSSWKIGISHFSLSFLSISKHLGAAISSRLIPPNEPLIR